MIQIENRYDDINRVSKYLADSDELAIITEDAIDLEKNEFEKFFSKSFELTEYSQSILDKPRMIYWLNLNYEKQ